MDNDSTTATALFAGAAWFDPIEAGLRGRIRGFIEELVEQELTEALGRQRHERGGVAGHRHGRRERRLTGSFGPVEIAVPRARLRAGDGTTREWRSAVLPRYARMTRQVEALIAGAYLSGTNTRRVGRALGALFRGAVGKDVVSRTWRKVKTDWEAWCRRDLGAEGIVRLILDGTVVRVRVDRKATSVSLLVVLGGRRDEARVAAPPDNPQQRVVADRHHEPAREARRRAPAERQAEMMNDVFKPRRSPRPRGEHVGVEALGENPSPAQDGVAVEPARKNHQANRASRDRQVRQPSAIPAVDPLGGRSAAGAGTRPRHGADGDQRAGVVARRVIHDKAARHESGGAESPLHGVDPLWRTTQDSIPIPTKVSQSPYSTPIPGPVSGSSAFLVQVGE